MKFARLMPIIVFAVLCCLMLSVTAVSGAQEFPTTLPTLRDLRDGLGASVEGRAGWDLNLDLVVTQTDGSTIVTRFGASDTITVALAAQPTAPVTLMQTWASNFITLPRKVVFTPENWDIPQTLTVYAAQDYIATNTTNTYNSYGLESFDENGAYSYKYFSLGIPVTVIGTNATPPTGSLVVTTLADSVSEVIPGSLRQMVSIANARAGIDTITLQDGLTGTITLAGNLPVSNEGMTLIGPGQDLLTIDGAGVYEGFFSRWNLPEARYTFTAQDLAFANLYNAINFPYVFLTDVTVRNSGNGATLLQGFPAVVGYEKTTLNRVTMRENTGFAGGALTSSEVDIIDSTFIDNQAFSLKNTSGDVLSYDGGAIRLEGYADASWIRRSTFAGNIASTGGAIFLDRAGVYILHSTFSANIATLENGVAAITEINSGPSQIYLSTFSGHNTGANSGGVVANVNLNMSIIANNSSDKPKDCGEYVEGLFNLTDDPNCPGHTMMPTGIDPVLRDNGGYTMTHALLPGSNAINADQIVDNGLTMCTAFSQYFDFTTDQRGVPRPYGKRCDFGAFEASGDGITLIANGGFETAKMVTYPDTIETRVDAWRPYNLKAADKRLCTKVDAPITTAEGRCVFQFSASTPPALGRSLKQTLEGDQLGVAGDTLTLSAMVQANKLQVGAKIIVTVTYRDNTTAKIERVIPKGTYAFRALTKSLILSKRVQKIVVTINIGKATGRVRLDTVSLALHESTPLGFPNNNTRHGAENTLPATPDSFREEN